MGTLPCPPIITTFFDIFERTWVQVRGGRERDERDERE
jgi:uncharacterized membrane protein